jgi:hypothetical protein
LQKELMSPSKVRRLLKAMSFNAYTGNFKTLEILLVEIEAHFLITVDRAVLRELHTDHR